MDPTFSQDSLSALLQSSHPVTPEPPHAQLPATATAAATDATSKLQPSQSHMTPPPSTQVPSSQRAKTRTPTPTMSHISTPPPTELATATPGNRIAGRLAGTMSAEQIGTASAEELRQRMTEMQAALQEAKMSAAHHKLQYQMLSQESAAAIERMAVEARMSQFENEVIHLAEQKANRVAAAPVQASPFQEGMVPVQKDLYQRMCSEIRELQDERKWLVQESEGKDKTITRQEIQIASLSDRVELMRERIRENREQAQQNTRPSSRYGETPRSAIYDPLRRGVASHGQPQPFAALLQASEMASQEARRPAKKAGHVRNAQSTSSLPSTPHRGGTYRQPPPVYQTPTSRRAPPAVPSTAPQPRTSALRTPDIYGSQQRGASQHQHAHHHHHRPPTISGHISDDGTVSASDDDNMAGGDEDSEAETDILEPDSVNESQASRTASQMLRTSQEDRRVKQASFEGRGLLEQSPSQGSQRSGMKQTKLFGAVRKRGREEGGSEDGAKRVRTGGSGAVGLGIAGVRD